MSESFNTTENVDLLMAARSILQAYRRDVNTWQAAGIDDPYPEFDLTSRPDIAGLITALAIDGEVTETYGPAGDGGEADIFLQGVSMGMLLNNSGQRPITPNEQT